MLFHLKYGRTTDPNYRGDKLLKFRYIGIRLSRK